MRISITKTHGRKACRLEVGLEHAKRSVNKLELAHVLVHSFRQRLHKRGFICNRIVFNAATPSVYTTPIETVGETESN